MYDTVSSNGRRFRSRSRSPNSMSSSSSSYGKPSSSTMRTAPVNGSDSSSFVTPLLHSHCSRLTTTPLLHRQLPHFSSNLLSLSHLPAFLSSSTPFVMASPLDSSKVVYVISGASRGLGYAVVEKLASRANSVIYAGARDPSKADKLQQLAQKHSNVQVVLLRADSVADHRTLATRVEKEAGRADVVWANAGACNLEAWLPVERCSVDEVRADLEINTLHPLVMYQAFLALLSRSSSPKFFVSSSFAGSISGMQYVAAIHQLPYGLSKAAVNYLTRRIHFENPNITAVPFHPGFVQTEGGNASAVHLGMAEAPMKLDDCTTKIVALLDEATRDSHGGKYWNVELDNEIGW